MRTIALATSAGLAQAGLPQIFLTPAGRTERKHDMAIIKSPRVDMDYAEIRDAVRPVFTDEKSARAFIPVDVDIDVSEPPTSGVYALALRMFSIGHIAPQDSVEKFLKETGAASKHMPLRYSALFGSYYRDEGHISVDENGDSCIGRMLNGEFCEMAVDCLLLDYAELQGQKVRIHVALPVHFANRYQVEATLVDAAHIGDSVMACSTGLEPGTRTWRVKTTKEASETGAHAAAVFAVGRILGDQVPEMEFAMSSLPMWLLYADEPSEWWAKSVGITDVASSWVEMMATAFAYVGQHGIMSEMPGQFFEFGVAKGSSLLYLSHRLADNPPPNSKGATIHGFDSFQGLPGAWHKWEASTFNMGGEVPEVLIGRENVVLHKGWFNETLSSISMENGLVAFAHIDVDMYESTIEVLNTLKCLLAPGSVLVFDEFFNLPRWNEPRRGEFAAWRLLTEEWGLEYEFLGVHYGQAVPLMVTKESEDCMLVAM